MNYLSKYSYCLTIYKSALHCSHFTKEVRPMSSANIKHLFRMEPGPVLLNRDKVQWHQKDCGYWVTEESLFNKVISKKVIKQCEFSMCSIVLANWGSRVLFSCFCSQWNVPVNIQLSSGAMNMRNISFLEANRIRLTGNSKRSMRCTLLKSGRTLVLISIHLEQMSWKMKQENRSWMVMNGKISGIK